MATLKPTLKITGKITAWSFSRWSDYIKCAYKAGLKHVMKMKEPPNPAMDRGQDIHDDAAAYTCPTYRFEKATQLTPARKKYQKGTFPPSLINIKKELTAIRKAAPNVEQQWAFTSDWVRTGWFDRNVVCRIKVDAYYFGKVVAGKMVYIEDYKSGKPHPEEQMPQLELYILGAFLMFPDVQFAEARFLYTDHPDDHKAYTLENTPEEVARLKKLWAGRTIKMLNDTRFAPTPSRFCQWCPFRAANGGPCIH